MSEFVEQCRAEWKRLGVPDALAEEMAAEVTADLEEAEADGLSAEDVLGSSASDPRSFAASWAAERGIVPEPSDLRSGRPRPRFLVAFTVVAAIALIASALLLATGEPKVSLVAHRVGAVKPVSPPPPFPTPAGRVTASAATPIEWILLVLAIVAVAYATWLWSSWARSQQRAARAA